MTTVGIGVDIVSVHRVQEVIERNGDRALERLFTPEEVEYCDRFADRFVRYAGRFAAKEAVAKALGTGFTEGVTFTRISIVNEPSGSPCVELSAGAADLARQRGIGRVLVSISHETDRAVAFAVALSDGVQE
jgi:holo-[acyl-carrier protein] synthase